MIKTHLETHRQYPILIPWEIATEYICEASSYPGTCMAPPWSIVGMWKAAPRGLISTVMGGGDGCLIATPLSVYLSFYAVTVSRYCTLPVTLPVSTLKKPKTDRRNSILFVFPGANSKQHQLKSQIWECLIPKNIQFDFIECITNVFNA
jgi:hypothetical protein